MSRNKNTLIKILDLKRVSKLYALIERPPLAFADRSHVLFNVEMWFLLREFFDGLITNGAVKVSMKLLVTVNTSLLAIILHF